jgi:hypothetical protein
MRLSLVKHEIPGDSKPTGGTHQIFVIDCSGSMSGNLGLIRSQLKERLPAILNPSDFASIVWFSGKGQCDVLAEHKEISNAADIGELNKAIDKWLVPVGLTGFVDPLNKVLSLVSKYQNNSLVFLTDGHDNQSTAAQVIESASKLAPYLSSALFVEYGWNCNKELIGKMAMVTSGTTVFCENFERYSPAVESYISNASFGKTVEVTLQDRVASPVAFVVTKTGPRIIMCDGQKAKANVGDTIWYITDAYDSVAPTKDWLTAMYQLAALQSSLGNNEITTKVLSAIGDVALFNRYANAFGKQNLTDFYTAAVNASNHESMRFVEGQSNDLKVDPNAYTLVELLNDLTDGDNYIIMSRLRYNRTTIAEDIAEDALKFVDDDDLVPISGITWNESRPNASLKVYRQGHVLLDADADVVKRKLTTRAVGTFIWRNYTIIKDGIANFDILPVRLCEKTERLLIKKGVIKPNGIDGSFDYFINLRSMPSINQSMAKEVSAIEMIKTQHELINLRTAQKVFKHFRTLWAGTKDEVAQASSTIHPEVVAYFESVGISQRNGFTPKSTPREQTDVYQAIELKLAIAGLSSIPSIKDLEDRIANKKSMTPSFALMLPHYLRCTTLDNQTDKIAWIIDLDKKTQEQINNLSRAVAQRNFVMVLSKIWPKEFKTRDENEIIVDIGGNQITGTITLKDIEIKI